MLVISCVSIFDKLLIYRIFRRLEIGVHHKAVQDPFHHYHGAGHSDRIEHMGLPGPHPGAASAAVRPVHGTDRPDLPAFLQSVRNLQPDLGMGG